MNTPGFLPCAGVVSVLDPVRLSRSFGSTASAVCLKYWDLASESRRPARGEPGPLHNARNLCDAGACPEGDCSPQGHYLDRNHSTRDDRSDEQELAPDKLCFALPFLSALIYPGHGQLIPLLIRLLLGVESPVDRRG